MTPETLLKQLQTMVSTVKRRYLLYRLSQLLPWLLASFGFTYVFSQQLVLSLIVGVLSVVLVGYLISRSKPWPDISLPSLLFDLNHRFAQLEHSAQLVLKPTTELTTLSRLQQQKVSQELARLIEQNHWSLLPRYPWLRGIKLCGLLSVVLIGLLLNNPLDSLSVKTVTDTNELPTTLPAAKIIEQRITILPPSYTGLDERQSSKLDIVAPVGSKITWQLRVEHGNQPITFMMDESLQHTFIRNGEDQFSLSFTPKGSGVYRLQSGEQVIGSVHSLVLENDSAPVIRVQSPKRVITEIAKSAIPTIETIVHISDDFGISKTDIVASVAKGSGEAVKFRDSLFDFDTIDKQQEKTVYRKQWSLDALGMEPGDELYFTVRAWDNRQPENQMSRSQTYIYRWLDDATLGLTSDGIVIDVMPEYFKSQRQIIIETKQLIADKKVLSASEFDATSRSLGHSQGDLKLKYGQYLGDEFDDGSGGHTMEEGPGVPDVHTKDGDHGDDDEHEDHGAQLAAGDLQATASEHSHHEEQHSDHSGDSTDKSGYQKVIEQYGHNHGDTDLGALSAQSPTAQMKQAIAYMWQAELQLMLSAPEKALPYEQQALKYLNRARKAERIYVKRLGFEPPPVSEERRYQGDLSDIRGYHQQQDAPPLDKLDSSMAALVSRLTEVSANIQLSSQDIEHIERVKSSFSQQANARPALLVHVATMEQMLLSNQPLIAQCDDCLKRLIGELWSQLSEPVALPTKAQQNDFERSELVSQYQQFIQQLKDDK